MSKNGTIVARNLTTFCQLVAELRANGVEFDAEQYEGTSWLITIR